MKPKVSLPEYAREKIEDTILAENRSSPASLVSRQYSQVRISGRCLEAAHTEGTDVRGMSGPFLLWQVRAQSEITWLIKVSVALLVSALVKTGYISCSRPETPNS